MRVKKKRQPMYVGLVDDAEDDKAETKKPLPVTAIIPRIWHRSPEDMWENLQLPVLTSEPLGRLGNVMGEYATLLGLGRVYGATVRLHPKMERKLKPTFPNITMEPIPGDYNVSEWTRVPSLTQINYGMSEAAAAGILGPELFVITDYPFEIQLFNTFPDDIKREFAFSRDIQRQVQKFREDNSKYLTGVTIGVHVRRTDYMHAMTLFKSVVPEHAYFKRATDYFREKYPGCRFLVSSDDLSFAKRSFGAYTDVLFTPGSVPAVDMALLASCDHSIITLGSYGFWCGYLSGGEVVYPDIAVMPSYTFQRTWYEYGQLQNFTPLPP
ncbi:galactoside alpha-(1,2)-fucosyltransferase 2-like [Macrobrachium rosenbergii]|uniref:galactoside alpha-(1,2)-fucosyltransferase 2-like n=1 Tax=Macrobrachium rosenbergii TaxID=79674 RepID=UPI0034D3DCF9